MTDSIIRADAILSARRPGVTASSLRAGTEQSLRSVYSLGHSAIASLPGSLHSITEEAVTPFTLACFLIIIVEFGERFNYYTTKILYGSYCTQVSLLLLAVVLASDLAILLADAEHDEQ